MIGPLRRSLSLRLLMIFVATGACMIVVVFALLREGLSSQWRRAIQPHLQRYVAYVLQDLGDPPRLERARTIAADVPADIALYRNGAFVGATDGGELPLERLRFRSPGPRGGPARRAVARVSGGEVTISGDRRGPILRVRRGEWDVYLRLDARSRARGYADELAVAAFATALVLLCSWFAIRHQLRAVGRIGSAVERMGAGELDARTGLSGDDDLARLGASVDAMAARLVAMLDAKRELLLAVSHELRSPIARARVALELLPPGKPRTRLRDDLLDMQALVDGLLETERLSARHDVLSLARVDLAALVRDVVSTPSVAEAAAPHIRTSLPAELPLRADAARLRVLVRNLVDNAVRHGASDDGAARVHVALAREAGSAVLRVSDAGVGIAPGRRVAVLEPFERLDPSRSRRTGGVGLGLALVQRIVAAHGGELALGDARPHGLVVTATLPLEGPFHERCKGPHDGPDRGATT